MGDFVPLDASLRPVQRTEPSPEPADAPALPEEPGDELHDALSDALADVRRFRAAVADAADAALQDLLRDIAAGVLARELRLSPANLEAVVREALRRSGCESPIFVRVHPEEVESVRAIGCNIVADARLRRGDAALDVRSGTIDVTLGARLDAVLAACA